MEKNLKIGDQVLIFERRYQSRLGIEPYKKGIVISHQKADELSVHGSPWSVDLYKVMGEDKKEYIGSYGHSIIGNAYYYTIEDYIDYLNYKIKENNREIEELLDRNRQISDYINNISKQEINSKQKVRG